MHVLVVICHPKQDSFTHAIADQVIKGAESREHTTKVLDLYRDGFDPVFTPRDWEQFEEVPMPEDVLEQQRFIEESDAIFLVFPIWWYQMPAMLKGWLDRVWSAGWCYKSERNPEGSLLAHRPCTVLALAGASSSQLKRWGYENRSTTFGVTVSSATADSNLSESLFWTTARTLRLGSTPDI